MDFEQDRSIEIFGEKTGYIFSYFLFTTFLFYILVFLNNIPESWSYIHIMGITFTIVFVGISIKRFLN